MAVKKVILIGGGGHALSLLEMLDDMSTIAGYVDLVPNDLMPIKYLGNDEFVLNHYLPNNYEVHHALVYKDKVDFSLRKKMIDLYCNYNTHSFIARSALVTANSKLSAGSAIFEKTIINRSMIGHNCVINTGSIIEHDCKIGNNVFIAPGVTISGEVTINSNTFVGSGVIVRDGVTICENVIIGMGSVVTRDLLVPGKYYGIPAKLVEKYG